MLDPRARDGGDDEPLPVFATRREEREPGEGEPAGEAGGRGHVSVLRETASGGAGRLLGKRKM